jgi:hypothetical protein
MSHADRILYLACGTLAEGTDYYAYLAVDSHRLEALQQAERRGNFLLSDYGEIIIGQKGTKNPSAMVQAKVNELFQVLSRP